MYKINNISYGSMKPGAVIDYGDQIVLNARIRSEEKTDEQTGETSVEWFADGTYYTPSEFIQHQQDLIAELSDAIIEIDGGDGE